MNFAKQNGWGQRPDLVVDIEAIASIVIKPGFTYVDSLVISARESKSRPIRT
jgi:hypothetical protein